MFSTDMSVRIKNGEDRINLCAKESQVINFNNFSN